MNGTNLGFLSQSQYLIPGPIPTFKKLSKIARSSKRTCIVLGPRAGCSLFNISITSFSLALSEIPLFSSQNVLHTFAASFIVPAASDLVSEYGEKTRVLARKLLQGISQSLGLEEDYIEKAMELDKTTQIFAANYYPPCPDPESAIGIPPHTDPGLLSFLLQNGVGGLEIQHEGKWFHLNAIPGSIFVNTADHVEIMSNGKYKSVWHRAVVNNSKKRISLVVANGPGPDTVVAPAVPLLEDAPAKYAPMSYMEYVEVQRSTRPPQKPILDRLKLY